MTEEQKAEEYIQGIEGDECVILTDRAERKQAFIEGYHEGFKDCAKARLNVTTISDCPIKATVEQKAEYVDTRNKAWRTRHDKQEEINYFTGFDDGYHECQKKHEWHDLEKDPTDLPKKDKKYVVKVKEYAGISVYIGRYWEKEKMFTGYYLQELDVIKWKEIE